MSDSPGRFTEELNALIWAGLLVEKPVVEGETLPRLQLSENGKRALEFTDAGTKEREG